MDVVDGIPAVPNLPMVSLPAMRAPVPQRRLEAPPALPSNVAHPATSPFTTTPLDVVLGNRNAAPTLPVFSPFTTTPLDVVMRSRAALPALPATTPFTTTPLRATRGRNTNVGRVQQRAPYFLLHPPNEPPKCDTRAMVRFGTEAQTGHHVLRPIRTRRGRGKRPDTPVPPFRLLTDRPVLLEDADRLDEDVSMSSASVRSASIPPASFPSSSAARIEENERTLAVCSPLPQSWAASNSRLEKLQDNARRCALSSNIAPEDAGTSGIVFGVYKALTDIASTQNTVEPVGGNINEQESYRGHSMDLDEPIVEEERESKQLDPCGWRLPTLISGSAVAIESPRQGTSGPNAVRERTRSSSSLSSLSSISLTSSFVHVTPNVSPPAHDQDGTGSQSSEARSGSLSSRVSTPYLSDCRSTRQTLPLFLDHSDVDSLPSLQEVPTDEESPPEVGSECVPQDSPLFIVDDKGRRLPPSQNEPIPITRAELDEQIERIARPPSTPANHDWPLTTHWTHNQTAFVTRVREVQHADALALLRPAFDLVERSPEILDTLSMQANVFVDTDLINELARSTVSDEGCTQFAQRVQTIRDTVDSYSPGLVDDTRVMRNLTSAPVALDGSRHRLFSARALAQPMAYRYAIYLLAQHHPDWIFVYVKLRKLVKAYIRYLEDLFKQRGWDLDEELLHRPAPIPPPYLSPHEYSQFRIFLYTFELHGYTEVAQVMADFLRYRFQEPEVVAHLLHAGLFDPHDIHLRSAKGEAFVTRRTAPPSYRASRAFAPLFRNANFFRQKKPRLSLHGDSSAGN
ncbi:hypothetical protein DFH06DRAFT_1122931 [Mycena polygramma]|nr:hypothetical protein DFH06DRAFT_1122931 [Mycena polygramma]